MLAHERRRELLRQMRTRRAGNVNDLAHAIGVSPSTIRRDLREMDEQGLLIRVHGGASLPDNELEVAHLARRSAYADEKQRIGEAAGQLVRDYSTILVTGGTTTDAMLPCLGRTAGLTVVTNSLNVAGRLSRYPDITVVVLGGILRQAEMSLLGALAERAITDFHVDTAFTGAYGVDIGTGLTGASVHEASTDRSLLNAVGSVVVLADSSKFSQRGPVQVATIAQIDTLITDRAAPRDSVQAISACGVDVRLV